MSYRLNKTDGTLLTELIDGKIDATSTDLTFIGKNYTGFGEVLNENFIKLLESFANTSAPSKPIKGQCWFDTSNNRLKVYDGTTFRSTDNSSISATAPLEKIVGDIWIDSSKNQMYFWDGIEWVLVGPDYQKSQGLSGLQVVTVKDTFGLNKIILKLYIGGSPVVIIAKEAFTPAVAITGYTAFRVGINISTNYSNFIFGGTADKALSIVDSLGNDYAINDFVNATDVSGDTMAGRLHIANDNGLIVGADSDHTIKVNGDTVEQRNNITNSNHKLVLNKASGPYTAQYWDAENQRLGIMKDNPAYTLDVTGSGRFTGDLNINGNLTVGTVVNEEVKSLRIADKQIQLALPEDSTLLDSASQFVDDAGLLIETTAGSIKWTYRVATGSWTTEDNINIADTNGSYKIDGNDILTRTALASSVTSAPGLVNIGGLTSLTVDNLTFDGDEIKNTTNGITLNAAGPINLTTKQVISNVTTVASARAVAENALLTEGNANDVVTKQYVDVEIGARPYVFGIDATGLTVTIGTGDSINADVKAILVTLAAPGSIPNGTLAKIHASKIAASGTDTANVNSALNKSFLAVDSGGTQNASVLQDVSAAAVPITTTFTTTRFTMEYKVIAGAWTHMTTVAYTP